ncbi:stage II sporulation protein M [Lunatibacter salilacus]|uniref:stage II sporulation protein M n=1 Tax=Lunatibacter salilacus TaxID=2483804 RepID=UPI00131B247F|nr:stage II sporulation protein M [Lunatibacter salilacus]
MSLNSLTLSATAVYLTGMLVGFYIDPVFEMNSLDNTALIQTFDQPKPLLFWSIAGNNLSVALINLAGGFSLGIVSLLNTFYNGSVLGYAFSVAGNDLPVTVILRHLLPHAIEIVGIILSCSLGLYLGIYLIRAAFLDIKAGFNFKGFMIQAGITLIILLVAAYLEAYVSLSG